MKIFDKIIGIPEIREIGQGPYLLYRDTIIKDIEKANDPRI